MDISKKSLILSLVTAFICLAVAAVCLVVMKANTVSIVLSAAIVAFAIFVCVFSWKVARINRK